MREIKNNQRGFTLVELLLYTVIAAGLLLSITTLISLLIQSRVKNQTMSTVEQQGTQVLQIISQEIRNAKLVSSPTLGNTTSNLQLQNQNNESIIISLSSSTLYYSKSGQVITLTPLNIEVDNFSVTNLGPDQHNSLKLQFDLKNKNLSGRSEYNYNQTFYGTANLR